MKRKSDKNRIRQCRVINWRCARWLVISLFFVTWVLKPINPKRRLDYKYPKQKSFNIAIFLTSFKPRGWSGKEMRGKLRLTKMRRLWRGDNARKEWHKNLEIHNKKETTNSGRREKKRRRRENRKQLSNSLRSKEGGRKVIAPADLLG